MENKVTIDHISFFKLREIDFTLLYKWYNTDFVNKWYGKEKQEWKYKEIENKYKPYIQGQKPTDSYIILYNDIKVGYIQTYLLKNYPEYNELVQVDDNSAGIDLLIGEKEYIHKGLGPIIIKKFLKDIVFQNKNIKSCVIGPEPKNIIAIKAYKKVGFKYIKTIKIQDEHKSEYIMEISKNEIE
jgi:RimJ/RimL family protein N-acetyltransferase